MARNPKPVREKKRAVYEVSCFGKGTELWFKFRDGSRSTHKRVYTRRRAEQIVCRLLRLGATEAWIECRDKIQTYYPEDLR